MSLYSYKGLDSISKDINSWLVDGLDPSQPLLLVCSEEDFTKMRGDVKLIANSNQLDLDKNNLDLVGPHGIKVKILKEAKPIQIT